MDESVVKTVVVGIAPSDLDLLGQKLSATLGGDCGVCFGNIRCYSRLAIGEDGR